MDPTTLMAAMGPTPATAQPVLKPMRASPAVALKVTAVALEVTAVEPMPASQATALEAMLAMPAMPAMPAGWATTLEHLEAPMEALVEVLSVKSMPVSCRPTRRMEAPMEAPMEALMEAVEPVALEAAK
mmetsp:Transcript_74574/g.131815  ORF Transcript_74574/g.131815 Transcript_74574/m.131815 type:complete len:129 (+) Transcript_74574:193-579(+)